jgi:hypothetical protein
VKKLMLVPAFVAITATVPLEAHHSFAAYYIANQSVSIEGKVEELEYKNPHVWLYIEAADKKGKLQKISAEWSAPNRLLSQGVTKDTLKPGDHVIVTGSPSRDTVGYKIQLKKLYRFDDGWTWSEPNTPR